MRTLIKITDDMQFDDFMKAVTHNQQVEHEMFMKEMFKRFAIVMVLCLLLVLYSKFGEQKLYEYLKG